jgi:alkylation response protein AidB-like acyl-CoA dehydrogenase
MVAMNDTDSAVQALRAKLQSTIRPELKQWLREGSIPRGLFATLGRQGLLGLHMTEDLPDWSPCSRRARVLEETARLSAGVAIAVLAHVDLGFAGLHLFGTPDLKRTYGPGIVTGEILACLGNTEGHAGSEVAAIRLTARQTGDGWRLDGTKAYVTNGALADCAVITAVTDPDATRNQRLSMFWVDLNQPGVRRRKLKKGVWPPSDLTRLTFEDVRVPASHLLGARGRGLPQVLTIFTHSRVPISALTLGSAAAGLEMALERLRRRRAFGRPLAAQQAKAFEAAEHYARWRAARAMLTEACGIVEAGKDFRLAASTAKFLAVDTARRIGTWAADLFGAASVMTDHPVHRFPLDAWASSLGEGTQDIQKLIIAREILAPT